MVWEFGEKLRRLANRNSVTLEWVPGHKGIASNKKADELARAGSSTLMNGPEPSVGIHADAKRTLKQLCTYYATVRRWTTGDKN